MAERTDTTTAKAEDAKDAPVEERELSAEELDEVSGGSGAGKRNAYNASVNGYNATIQPNSDTT